MWKVCFLIKKEDNFMRSIFHLENLASIAMLLIMCITCIGIIGAKLLK